MSNHPAAPCAAVLPPLLATKVETVSLASLQPFKTNARKHGETQIRKLVTSIERFGFVTPILIDGSGTIVAGHGRIIAARRLGLESVPAIRLDHLSESELRAYRIADNRLAERAEWDPDTLAIEWQELQASVPDLDLTITGFELPEIEAQIDTAARRKKALDRADVLSPADDPAAPVSRPGDLWELGPHRLLCGDARDPAAYQTLLEAELADVVFTDSPYNVAIDGHVGGSGSVRHREFVMGAGEMSSAAFTAFLGETLGNLARFSHPGSIHFVAMDWRHLPELLQAGMAVYSAFKNLCVWVKDNGRDGVALPVAARARPGVQERGGGAPEQRPAGQVRTLSHQCVELCGGELAADRAHGGAAAPPHGEAGGPGRRCLAGLLEAGRPGPGRVCRQRHDLPGGGSHRPAGAGAGTRSPVCRCRGAALAELDRRAGTAGRER